jgi:hypothetical protein
MKRGPSQTKRAAFRPPFRILQFRLAQFAEVKCSQRQGGVDIMKPVKLSIGNADPFTAVSFVIAPYSISRGETYRRFPRAA